MIFIQTSFYYYSGTCEIGQILKSYYPADYVETAPDKKTVRIEEDLLAQLTFGIKKHSFSHNAIYSRFCSREKGFCSSFSPSYAKFPLKQNTFCSTCIMGLSPRFCPLYPSSHLSGSRLSEMDCNTLSDDYPPCSPSASIEDEVPHGHPPNHATYHAANALADDPTFATGSHWLSTNQGAGDWFIVGRYLHRTQGRDLIFS